MIYTRLMTADLEIPVSALLERWQGGDEAALHSLVPLVYEELRRLAGAQVRLQDRASLQPSELVAEAYLKLVEIKSVSWRGRAHFFSLAARTMRTVLVDRYRRRHAERRGGHRTMLTLSEGVVGSGPKQLELDRLDDALKELEALDARQAEIVTLRFFGGLKGEEIAEVLGISPRTVKREWAVAKLWLYKCLARAD
ncbi:MAG: ECF-type sigma factor [Acidobacteriota bacterium]